PPTPANKQDGITALSFRARICEIIFCRLQYSRSGPCIAAKAAPHVQLGSSASDRHAPAAHGDVRFAPKADKRILASVCPLSAKSGLTHRSKIDYLVDAGEQ